MSDPKSATAKKKIAIVGGGATGVSFMWAVMTDETLKTQVELTLYHNEASLGGHSHTVEFEYENKKYPIDVGVQYICPEMYPNTFAMLERDEMKGVAMQKDIELKLASTFTETKNWGNFPAYQSGPAYDELYTDANAAAGPLFAAEIMEKFATKQGSTTVRTILDDDAKREIPLYPQAWIDYFLLPYLSILNGYGDDNQLYLATAQDLFPIFGTLNPWDGLKPLGSFDSPGVGWERFAEGSGSWIDAMAAYARNGGVIDPPVGPQPNSAAVLLDSPITKVYPDVNGNGAWVEGPNTPATLFDEVVLTTDMTTNRNMLDNTDNALYPTQAPYISYEKFPLNPGSCFIHQDDSVLAPYIKTRDETVQFTAYYAQTPTDGLTYDMSESYSTYICQNMVEDLPVPVYVSMYGKLSADVKNPPTNHVVPPVDWAHGRFLGSFMYTSKTALHNIQGKGNIWFAGNNTTVDSEEGALTSAMIILQHICPSWVNPLVWHPYADFMLSTMEKIMFPSAAGGYWERFVEDGLKGLVRSKP